MSRVYLTLNQQILERLLDGRSHPEKTFRSTFGLFNALEERIGLENVRVISPNGMYHVDDLYSAQVYGFDQRRILAPVYTEHVETPILCMVDDNGFLEGFSMEEIERQHTWYSKLIEQGRIGHMINTVASKEKNDKRELPRLFSQFPQVSQLGIENPSQLVEAVYAHPGVICKHRFGSDGLNFYRATIDTVETVLTGLEGRYSEFIFQLEVEIDAESRLLFLAGEFVGARIISDRTRPWEIKGQCGRKHHTRLYTSSEEEIADTLAIAEIAGQEFGSVDWVYDSEGKRYLLEVNDAGTALASRDSKDHSEVYDVSGVLADRLVSYL